MLGSKRSKTQSCQVGPVVFGICEAQWNHASLILDDVPLSLKTCLLKVFLLLFLMHASACICELTVLRKGALPLIPFFSCKASPLFWKWLNI